MQRNQLSDVAIFVEVARQNGFRAAADALGLQAASVSEAVQRFEDRLGVRLFERSTRAVALTSVGQWLYEHALPAINDLEAAFRDLEEQRDSVSGTLRLSAPYSAGAFFLDDLVARFAEQHPDVTVELIYDDQKVDLISSQVDAAIRATTLLEAETHAVSVGPILRMALVAAPDYLDRRGMPQTPQDILNHDGICFAFGGSGALAPWVFESDDGPVSIMPRPRMITNDLRSLIGYASRGLGLAYVYADVAIPIIEAGQLVEIMPELIPSMPRYSLNYRSKRNMSKRLRAFVDMAKAEKTG